MTLQRAQELGIRTKRIDVRAVNKKRSIVLNLDHVVNILLDLQVPAHTHTHTHCPSPTMCCGDTCSPAKLLL